MNLTDTKIPLKNISIPELTSTEFATGLQGVIKNINDNFAILANHDFVKGDRGDSIKVIETELIDESGNLTEFGSAIVACIENSTDENLRTPIIIDGVEYNVFSNFYKNPGKLQLIYNTSDYTEDIPVGSLYYIFLDGRFANINISKATDTELAQYSDLSDTSCIIVYKYNEETKTGRFEILENAFPTVYYEKNVGLCWKINGGETGLPIQGIPGRNGDDSTLRIVKVGDLVSTHNRTYKFPVTHIFQFTEYEELNYKDPRQDDEIENYDGSSAVVLAAYDPHTPEKEPDKAFYFAKLKLEKNKTTGEKMLYAYCSTDARINMALFEEDVINAMRNISLSTTSPGTGMKGLFVPIEDLDYIGKTDENDAQSVHLITSSNISNIEGASADKKADMMIVPVKDINTLQVDEKQPLNINKYLYLKINDVNNNIFAKYKKSETETEFVNILENAVKCKYLKYKLDFIATDINSSYFNEYTKFDGSVGSKYFGNVVLDNGDKASLNDGNTIKASLQEACPEFANKLNQDAGIYRWELCTDIHEFDIEELENAEKETKHGKTIYKFDIPFKVVYTTTVNPTIDSSIMWFNALEYNGISEDNKFIIPGWEINNVLEFNKFVPIYNIFDDFKFKQDTALNINYNINITGDNKEDEIKNLTVNGNINSKNILADNITVNKNIYNIHTPNNIKGDKGIELAQGGFTVDSNGIMNANSIEVKDTASCGILNANEVSVDTASCGNINVVNDVSNFYIGALEKNNVFNSSIESFGISAKNVNKINIESFSKPKSNDSNYTYDDISVSEISLPVHINKGNNIIVSNQVDINEATFIKNTKLDKNDYVNNVDLKNLSLKELYNSASFDEAKDFNIAMAAKSIRKGTTNDAEFIKRELEYSPVNDENTIYASVELNENTYTNDINIVSNSLNQLESNDIVKYLEGYIDKNTNTFVPGISIEELENISLQKFDIYSKEDKPEQNDPIPEPGGSEDPYYKLKIGTEQLPIRLEFHLVTGGACPYSDNISENGIYLALTAGYDLTHYLISTYDISTVLMGTVENRRNNYGKNEVIVECFPGDHITSKMIFSDIEGDLTVYWTEKMKTAVNSNELFEDDNIYYEITCSDDIIGDKHYFEYTKNLEKGDFTITDALISLREKYIINGDEEDTGDEGGDSGDSGDSTPEETIDHILDEAGMLSIKFLEQDSFTIPINLKSKVVKGNYPKVCADSKMKLILAYSYKDDENTPVIKYLNTIGEYTFDNINQDWRGVNVDNNVYYNTNREICYSFIPKSYTLTSSEYKTIRGLFNNEKYDYSLSKYVYNQRNITFYIIPMFNITLENTNEKLINGISINYPYYTGSNVEIKHKNVLNAQNNRPTIKNDVKKLGTLYYSRIIESYENTNIPYKNTVICEDGIVIRHGKIVFGMGISKARGTANGGNPVIFYIDTENGFNPDYKLFKNLFDE